MAGDMDLSASFGGRSTYDRFDHEPDPTHAGSAGRRIGCTTSDDDGRTRERADYASLGNDRARRSDWRASRCRSDGLESANESNEMASHESALTGRESSVLALLAQRPDMPKRNRIRCLDVLTGKARSIGRAIVGELPETKASAAFLEWARSLK